MRAIKESIRQQVLAKSKLMTGSQRAAASARARASLAGRAVWRQAASILFFAPMPEELDVWPLLADALAAGKIVALPRFVPETAGYIACRIRNLDADLKVGYFGIREPASRALDAEMRQVDLILVPGVAFDLQGRRLGRGKGYYDRLLAAVSGNRCGVAFEEQIVDAVPSEPHDIRMDFLLTPSRWIELQPA
jgi:5-formyltetrahydrofolate cyclo-ligase